MSWRDRWSDDEQALVAARVRALREQARSPHADGPADSTSTWLASTALPGDRRAPTVDDPPSWADLPSAAASAPAVGSAQMSGGAPGGWIPDDIAHRTAVVDADDRGSGGGSIMAASDVVAARHGPPGWGEQTLHGDVPPRGLGAVSALRSRFRFDPGRRGLLALAGVVVVIGAVTGGWMLNGQPGSTALASSSQPVSASAGAVTASPAYVSPSAAASPTASASSSGAGAIVVDVAGEVGAPGVYTLPSGSRVEDALRAAGGPLPGADLSEVNRARVLSDGEQIAVGIPGALPVPGASAGSSGTTSTGGVIDLNTADTTVLEGLPGVGPVLAQHIVDWRSEHGRFGSVDDLQQVSGIGPAKFAEIKDLVRV